MKKLFLIFLFAAAFFVCFVMPAMVMSDEKDEALVVANLQTLQERVLRLEMQLALIQSQFKEINQKLMEARKLRDDLDKKVRTIEEKKKAAGAPKGKVEPTEGKHQNKR